VDEANQYASWQDWEFFWTFSRDAGIRLFDIRFQNVTIAYEVGLEEAIALYAGMYLVRRRF
jgi:primary-amine oxidase